MVSHYTWLLISMTALASCAPSGAGSVAPSASDSDAYEQVRLPGKTEQDGVRFESKTSRPIPLTLRDKAKIALLHDDKDDMDRYVRLVLEQTVFDLKATNPGLIIVERRSVDEILMELRFQAGGLVKDQDISSLGQFLGLDYVVVYELIHNDLEELYGLDNQIDTWEVLISVKVVEVKTAEVRLNCLATTKAHVARLMKATEVRVLNRDALAIAAGYLGKCVSDSVGRT
jgi:hypothetical protein